MLNSADHLLEHTWQLASKRFNEIVKSSMLVNRIQRNLDSVDSVSGEAMCPSRRTWDWLSRFSVFFFEFVTLCCLLCGYLTISGILRSDLPLLSNFWQLRKVFWTKKMWSTRTSSFLRQNFTASGAQSNQSNTSKDHQTRRTFTT